MEYNTNKFINTSEEVRDTYGYIVLQFLEIFIQKYKMLFVKSAMPLYYYAPNYQLNFALIPEVT